MIRETQMEDLPSILEIYAHARAYMAQTGNPRQWGPTNWPPETLLKEDIQKHRSYVLEDEDGIEAVFCFMYGDDIEPCYESIEGAWVGKGPYGVVHRIASRGTLKGAGQMCIAWAFEKCHDLRMDTHFDNKVMQHILKKMGFLYCGIIHVQEDDDPRFAYERIGYDE